MLLKWVNSKSYRQEIVRRIGVRPYRFVKNAFNIVPIPFYSLTRRFVQRFQGRPCVMDSGYMFVYLLCGVSLCAYQLVYFLTTKL